MPEPPFLPLILVAQRAGDRAIRRGIATRGFDVRPSHSAVLANIDIASGTRSTALAERAGVTKQAIGELVDDLEKRGFVTRVVDPADKRAKLVQLTTKGRKAIDAAYEVIGDIETAVSKAMGKKDVDATRRTLQAMIEYCGTYAPEE